MSNSFVHLNIHSEYSIHDGIVRINELLERTKKYNMPAVALTDLSNMFALVKFYKQAKKQDISAIIAAELTLLDASTNSFSQFIAICKNNTGQHNLVELITKSYQQGQVNNKATVQWDWIKEHSEGLIILSGGIEGDIAQALLDEKPELALEHAQRWAELFPQHFYIEITRTQRPGEQEYLHKVLEIARSQRLPLVATNAVRFLNKEDFTAHEARYCIQQADLLIDPKRPQPFSEEQYFKSQEQMQELFSDIPSALQNSVEITKRCKVNIKLDENYLPQFPIPKNISLAEYFQQAAQAGLDKKYKNMPELTNEQRAAYQQRLQHELNTINEMGFPGYFLIVADFIEWAKNNDVPVGPGRGSGAGSLVAYCLGITNLDPLQYDLLFERFLNPERVSLPDFDVDFCMQGRDRVIGYVANKYGHDCVAQIITYGSMAAKAVVRDVGRVLGHPYGFVDRIAKLIPFAIGMTLDKALEQEDKLRNRYNSETEVTTLIDLAKKLEGITRNAGKHAGGVVIAPSKLSDFCPLYCEDNAAAPVTQFDKDDVEAVGLVKFDFLGLRTLTIIKWALHGIQEKQNKKLDIDTIPTDDKKSFDLLKECNTTAVFQLESRGMKDLIRRLQPDCFEDIIALVALFRPGPLQSGMVDDFIERKHGRAQVCYPHPELEPILKPTYGVILYQEQVMQIAQVLAGYSLGSADLLRRAMGKKKPEEMAKQRNIFRDGAVNRGIKSDLADSIFDLMEKFAGYGFNKSHSAAYALIAYQTAYLKAHYPAEFMAAVLSSDMDNTDKISIFINSCHDMQLKILPPCVNNSANHFTVTDEGNIRFGLGAVKGLGDAAISSILQARKDNGKFLQLFDFCQRVDTRKVNRRALEAMIYAGGADCFQQNRATLVASIEKASKMAEQAQKNIRSGQIDLFATASLKATEHTDQQKANLNGSEHDYTPAKEWSDWQRLQHEKNSIGFYFSGHPLNSYIKEIKQISRKNISMLQDCVSTPNNSSNNSKASGFHNRKNKSNANQTRIVGMITQARNIMTRTGKKMGILSIEDTSGQLDITIFSEVLEQCQHYLVKDNIVVVAGNIQEDTFSGGIKMVASQLTSLQDFRSKYAKKLNIQLSHKQDIQSILPPLHDLLKQNQTGNCQINIKYNNATTSAAILLPAEHNITLGTNFLEKLQQNLGLQVEVQYCN